MKKSVFVATVGMLGLTLAVSGCAGEDDVETTTTPVVVTTPSESATPTEAATPTDEATVDEVVDVTGATEANQQILQGILADQVTFLDEFGLEESDKFTSGDNGDGTLSVNFGETPGAVGEYTYPAGIDDVVVTGNQNEFSIISVVNDAVVTTSYSGLLGSDALGATDVVIEDANN